MIRSLLMEQVLSTGVSQNALDYLTGLAQFKALPRLPAGAVEQQKQAKKAAVDVAYSRHVQSYVFAASRGALETLLNRSKILASPDAQQVNHNQAVFLMNLNS
jgi:hypothetical protein